jgi:flagellar protein FlgJ
MEGRTGLKIQNGFSLKPPTPEVKRADQDAALKDAAKMYENHFLNEMVKSMRTTVGSEEGFIKPSFAEKIFTEQLDQQYVDGWSQKGGVGLADMIYTQIKDQMGASEKHIQPLKHMLPIAPKKDLNGVGTPDSIQMKALPPQGSAKMSYRFEVPNPSSGGFEVQAPMPGKVTEATRLDQGWNLFKLDHGDGLTSEMTFPGQSAAIGLGSDVQAGQRLGILDLKSPVVAWNLDWT